jgi:hypothetical protein
MGLFVAPRYAGAAVKAFLLWRGIHSDTSDWKNYRKGGDAGTGNTQ